MKRFGKLLVLWVVLLVLGTWGSNATARFFVVNLNRAIVATQVFDAISQVIDGVNPSDVARRVEVLF